MRLLLLLLVLLNSEVVTEGRDGRGGGGARAGVGRGGGRGNIHGSSHYVSGSRSGTVGWKKGSKSSSESYGSNTFRSSLFSSPKSLRPIFMASFTNPFVIASIARPIKYDSRYYYWSSSYAQENLSPVEFPILCEYQIGEDDGTLQNVTFRNGTSARFLYFGCPGEMVDCCGMYCCHAIGDYLKLITVFTLLLIMVPVCYCCAKNGNSKNWAERDIPLVKISDRVETIT